MKLFLVIIFFSTCFSTDTPTVTTMGPGFNVTTSVTCNQITFTMEYFSATVANNMYIGIGVGSTTMANSDICLCAYISGVANCTDMWGTTPIVDPI